MKILTVLTIAASLILSTGCDEFSSTKVKARIVEHRPIGSTHYALLYEVLEPKKLAGHYGIGATVRGDLVADIDGTEHEIYLNSSDAKTLTANRPEGYAVSQPGSKEGDFLEMSKRVK